MHKSKRRVQEQRKIAWHKFRGAQNGYETRGDTRFIRRKQNGASEILASRNAIRQNIGLPESEIRVRFAEFLVREVFQSIEVET